MTPNATSRPTARITVLPTTISAMSANVTAGERSFRIVWDNLYKSKTDSLSMKRHLKSELRSWVISTITAKCGLNPGMEIVRLDEGDLGLLSELFTIVDMAFEQKWSIDRLVCSLQTTALSGGGLEL